jgi:hypothetical protein
VVTVVLLVAPGPPGTLPFQASLSTSVDVDLSNNFASHVVTVLPP